MMQIDGYSAVERIGQGGLGDVYRATHNSTGATVAIKVLRDVSDQSVVWHRTRRELTALVSLAGHAHVVRLIELLDLPDGPALVMEYAPGGSVAELMKRRDAPLDLVDAVLIGRHTAAALAAAHDQGIVHRDVKPQNLLIDAYGQVKLCDFGIAAMARSDEFQQRTSALSMRYASPEELDEREVGPPADVYSLGATLLHMVRGAPPTLRERLAPWEPPATDDDDLAALDAVIAGCLHPSPIERPTASAVLSELERIGWAIDDKHRAVVFESGGVGDAPHATVASAIPEAVGEHATVMRADEVDRLSESESSVGHHIASDATVPRRAAAPEPVERPSRSMWWLLVPAVVVGVIVGGWWLLTRGADAEPEVGSEGNGGGAVSIEDRPEGLVDIDSLVWPTGPVGECLAQVGDGFTPVACEQPHDLQRTAAGDLDPAQFSLETAFDQTAVRNAVASICDEVFERFVGVGVTDSMLMAPFTAPSEITYAADDRSYQCWVGMSGRRVVGDATGVGS